MKVLWGNCWVWIVGKWTSPEGWEFRGIYTEKSLAQTNCPDAEYFVAPVMLDKPFHPKQQMLSISARGVREMTDDNAG